jgi:hypothetical protein
MFDALVVVATGAWFLWLLAWPYAVGVATVLLLIGAAFLLHRRYALRALICLLIAGILAGEVFLVLMQLESALFQLVPAPARPFGQFVLLLFPLMVWLIAILWAAQWLWRKGGSPNSAMDGEAKLPPI